MAQNKYSHSKREEQERSKEWSEQSETKIQQSVHQILQFYVYRLGGVELYGLKKVWVALPR